MLESISSKELRGYLSKREKKRCNAILDLTRIISPEERLELYL
ncbi:16383_t:CDS:1, partial [Racocetra persica]